MEDSKAEKQAANERENVKERHLEKQASKGSREDKRDRDRYSDKPPTKKMRDDRREYQDKDRGQSLRGREFVSRGRGRNRGSRGSRGGPTSSRGRGGREYRSYERPHRLSSERSSKPRGRYNDGRQGKLDESEHSEGEDIGEIRTRRRGRDEDSDASVEETSGTVSESSSERASETRELSQNNVSTERAGNKVRDDRDPMENSTDRPGQKEHHKGSRDDKPRVNGPRDKREDTRDKSNVWENKNNVFDSKSNNVWDTRQNAWNRDRDDKKQDNESRKRNEDTGSKGRDIGYRDQDDLARDDGYRNRDDSGHRNRGNHHSAGRGDGRKGKQDQMQFLVLF